MTRSISILCLGLAVAACAATVAAAAEKSGTLSVRAQVEASCDIGGSPSQRLQRGLLDFGVHQLGELQTGGTGTTLDQPVPADLLILCNTSEAAPTLAFDQGLYGRGNQRYMHGPDGSFVPYVLLRGSSASAGEWDQMPHPVQLRAGVLTRVPVYGTIPALPTSLSGGLYTDTVTVQLDF